MKTFMIWLLMLVILIFVLTACAPAITATPTAAPAPTQVPPTDEVDEHTIRLATLDWPPYVGESLPQQGFTTAIVREAFKRAGYKVKIDFVPWTRAIQQADEGNYDAVYPEYYSDNRNKSFFFSEPFASGPLGFYKRKDDKIGYTKLEDLKPYRIGVVLGYINTPEFDAASYLQKETATSDEQNIRKLLAGRIDLIVIDKYVAQYLIKNSLTDAIGKLEFLEPPLLDQKLYVVFPRTAAASEKRLQELNTALKSMHDDGTLDRIFEESGFGDN
jgi:polar amino acid transport system substrate-binding protein